VTSIPAPGTTTVPAVSPEALSKTRVAVILAITLFLGLAVYYFVGVDEGMTSVFGKTLMVHEWVHDARHFLGFPCH
jgi:cobalt transporter subunit CbtB